MEKHLKEETKAKEHNTNDLEIAVTNAELVAEGASLDPEETNICTVDESDVVENAIKAENSDSNESDFGVGDDDDDDYHRETHVPMTRGKIQRSFFFFET